MIFAFLGAIASSIESLNEKLILRHRELTYKHLLSISFTITFSLGLLLTPFLGGINHNFWQLKYILFFIAEIIIAFTMNSLFFKTMKKVELCDVEPFVLLQGPFTAVLAALIFPTERSFFPLVLTLIAAGVLIWSRTEKHHLKLKFKKTTLALITAIFLVSIDFQFAKVLLEVMSPISYYAIRNGFLMVVFWAFFRPKFNKLEGIAKRELMTNGIIAFIAFTSRFYSIQNLGIVQTTLIFLLAPVITLAFSKIFLKEHVTGKKIFADAVIILCVILTILVK